MESCSCFTFRRVHVDHFFQFGVISIYRLQKAFISSISVIIISNLWILTRCIWVEFSNRLSNINGEHDKFGSHDSHSRHVVWTAINVHLMHVCLKADFRLPTCSPLNCLAIQLPISQNPPSVTSNVRPVSQNIVIRILTRFKIYEISLLYQILLVNNWNCNATEHNFKQHDTWWVGLLDLTAAENYTCQQYSAQSGFGLTMR